tara:strand:+ start:868 stop:1485 length:618 start_codon:yes stop_codon:yes gene_type:complete
LNKEEIINYFNLNKNQTESIEMFLSNIVEHNKHTNLIGRSTIKNLWNRHVLDCLQLSKYINSKKTKILDLGTGPGLPGVLLSIVGYKNILMIDSSRKKTEFVKLNINQLFLSAKIINKRIETVGSKNHDIIVSRALAPLNKLLTYALIHSNKKTTSLFLKGRNVSNELQIAKKNFFFDYEVFESISVGDGCILKIKNIKVKKNND